MPFFVLGLGCERGTPPEEVRSFAEDALRQAAVPVERLAAIATIETRASEPAILHAAAFFGVPLHAYPAGRLEEETPRLQNPSARVFAHVGCHGVAEAAALAFAGPDGELVQPKIKSGLATAAVARIDAARDIRS